MGSVAQFEAVCEGHSSESGDAEMASEWCLSAYKPKTFFSSVVAAVEDRLAYIPLPTAAD